MSRFLAALTLFCVLRTFYLIGNGDYVNVVESVIMLIITVVLFMMSRFLDRLAKDTKRLGNNE